MQENITQAPRLIRTQPKEKLTAGHLLILADWCNISQGSTNYKIWQITETIHHFLRLGREDLVTEAFQQIKAQVTGKAPNAFNRPYISRDNFSILVDSMDFARMTFPQDGECAQLVGLPLVLWGDTEGSIKINTHLPDVEQITNIIANSGLLPVDSKVSLQSQLLDYEWLKRSLDSFGNSFSLGRRIINGQAVEADPLLELSGGFAAATPMLVCGHLTLGSANPDQVLYDLNPLDYRNYSQINPMIRQSLEFQLLTAAGRVNSKPGYFSNLINAMTETGKLVFDLKIHHELKSAFIQYGHEAKVRVLLLADGENIDQIKLSYQNAHDEGGVEIETYTDPVDTALHLAKRSKAAGFGDIEILLCYEAFNDLIGVKVGNHHNIDIDLITSHLKKIAH